MGATLTIRDDLTPGLKRAAAKIADKKPILEAMGLQLKTITQGSWSNSSWRVAPWASLRPATIADKARRKTTQRGILRRSGELHNNWSLSYTADTVTIHSGAGAETGPYAHYHQFGTRRGIPARPMLPFIGGPDTAKLAPWAREKLTRIAQDKLASLLKQASGG